MVGASPPRHLALVALLLALVALPVVLTAGDAAAGGQDSALAAMELADLNDDVPSALHVARQGAPDQGEHRVQPVASPFRVAEPRSGLPDSRAPPRLPA